MSGRESSERDESAAQNRVFSLWTPKELHLLCKRVANKVCNKLGYRGEVEDTAQNLWLFLREHGHAVEHPEDERAIFNYLLRACIRSDKLRGTRPQDGRNVQIGADADGAPSLPPDNETAEQILERIVYKDLVAKVLQQAKGDMLKEAVKLLSEGATQTEVADISGVSQSTISKRVKWLRQRVRVLIPVAESSESKEKS